VLPIVSGLSTAYAQLILMPGYGYLWGYIGANACSRCSCSPVPSSDYRTCSYMCSITWVYCNGSVTITTLLPLSVDTSRARHYRSTCKS